LSQFGRNRFLVRVLPSVSKVPVPATRLEYRDGLGLARTGPLAAYA